MFPLIFAFIAFFGELNAELFKYILSKLRDKLSSPCKKRTRHKIIQVRPVGYERKRSRREKLSSALKSMCKAAKERTKKKRPKTPRSPKPVRLKLSAHRTSPTRLNKMKTKVRKFCEESKEKISNKTIVRMFFEEKFPVLVTLSIQEFIEKIVDMRRRQQANDQNAYANDPKLQRF
jgi:hypothetical protein